MVYRCFISNNSLPSPKIQTWQDEVLVQRLLFKRLSWNETKWISLECCLWIADFSGREWIMRRLHSSFSYSDSFSERRKLECEVYTLLFSLYNPQQKVAIYSSRKWIEAKHRNKSLRSLLIITRHFWLRAKLFERWNRLRRISNDVAMHVWCVRYSRYWSAAFLWEEKISFSWFIFNWENYRRSSDIVLAIIPFYTNHNWTTNPLELLVFTDLLTTDHFSL